MPDVLNPKQRSYCMSRIRGKDTKIELIVRHALYSGGFRFRVCPGYLPGKPDIVLPRYKTAIFIHGCFWHGHDCKKAKMPKSNKGFWRDKIVQNKRRDQKAAKALRKMQWSVITIWECNLGKRLNFLIKKLKNKRQLLVN